MKKIIPFVLVFFVLLIPSYGVAEVIEYGAGEYVTPDYSNIIGSISPVDIDHSYYYIWAFDDLNVPSELVTSISIVFHEIYNWQVEPNWLTVYLFDEPTSSGWSAGWDSASKTYPLWEHPAVYGATSLGTWSYGTETKDVVFTTSSPTLLAYLTGGESFGIGIDPDCHFYADKITVEVPVPEPATMLLLGSGLIGLAGFGRKRFLRKRG